MVLKSCGSLLQENYSAKCTLGVSKGGFSIQVVLNLRASSTVYGNDFCE